MRVPLVVMVVAVRLSVVRVHVVGRFVLALLVFAFFPNVPAFLLFQLHDMWLNIMVQEHFPTKRTPEMGDNFLVMEKISLAAAHKCGTK